MTRWRRNERGASALEFGLVFPAIMLAIFGIIQYGWEFWGYTTAKAVAREAARRSIVGYDWSCTVSKAQSMADGANLSGTPTVTRVFQLDNGTTSDTPVLGSIVEVTVTIHALDMHLPFLPVPNGGEITQSSRQRVENVPAVPLSCTQ